MRYQLLAVASAVASAGALALAAPPSAGAQEVLLAGEGTGFTSFTAPFTFVFRLPQSPTPSSFAASGFSLDDVAGRFVSGATDTTIVGQLRFGAGSSDGGFGFLHGPGYPTTTLNVFGAQLFTGSPGAPTFTLAQDVVPSRSLGTATVTRFSITPVATVPEPATWALLSTGLAVVGGASWRRRRARS